MRQGRKYLSLLLVLGVVSPVGAVESTLIDFTTFNDNMAQVVQQDQELYNQVIEERPELDIRNLGYPDFSYEASDWNLDQWRVQLNSSSDVIVNQKDSVTKNAPSQEHGNVLGVRLRFNPWENSFWGKVVMPLFLPATYLNGEYISQDENGNDNGLAIGLLANVGQIKNVMSWVYGLNYDYRYGVRVVDSKNRLFEYGMGSLRYEGWRRLVWNNDYYIDDARFVKPAINPLYPSAVPYLKYDSLMFYKPHGDTDPNYIGYVRDVTISYDYATIQEQRDINDEAVWGILAEEAITQRIETSKRIAEELTLRRNINRLKAAQEGNADNADAANAEADAAEAQ